MAPPAAASRRRHSGREMSTLLEQVGEHVYSGVGISNTLIERFAHALCFPHFAGVFCADRIPTARLLARDVFTLIINLVERDGPSSSTNGHFVAVCAEPGRVQYFDPFGRRPSQPLVNEFLGALCRQRRQLEVNRFQIQHLRSKYCGLYCVLFLAYQTRALRNRPVAFRLRFHNRTRKRLGNDGRCVEYLSLLIQRRRVAPPSVAPPSRS